MPALTLANALTLLRMLLAPIFVILVVYHYLGWALITFCAACITDLFDGALARWSGTRTNVGVWLDPMADKLLLLTVFVVLTLPGLDLANPLPFWLTVVVISRDVIIVLTVAVVNLASGPRTFKPSKAGKAATLIYFLTGIVAMYFNYLEQPTSLVTVCVYASLAIAVISGLHYIVHAINALEQA